MKSYIFEYLLFYCVISIVFLVSCKSILKHCFTDKLLTPAVYIFVTDNISPQGGALG